MVRKLCAKHDRTAASSSPLATTTPSVDGMETSADSDATAGKADRLRIADEEDALGRAAVGGRDDSDPRLRNRLFHVTWAWYLPTMSSGGFAALLGQQPHAFTGLETIGKVVFVWDLVLFVGITAMQVRRFVHTPSLLPRSLRNPTESLFLPTFLLSIANIIICAAQYGAPSTGTWLAITLRVLYWCYVAASILVAVVQYTFLFTTDRVSLETMSPAWILPVLPSMLCGTAASAVSQLQPAYQHMDIIVAGVTLQGLGFFSAVMLCGTLFAHLANHGMPRPNMRPAMFICVSPPAYTVYALVEISQHLPMQADYFIKHPLAAETLQTMALAFGVFIWSLALFFFGIAIVGVAMAAKHVTAFSLVWWTTIFPNVGMVLATIAIGRGLESQAILWLGSVMSCLIAATYVAVLAAHITAIVRGRLEYVDKDT